ncbi:MAG: thioredoxin family protein [Chloroflexota bacterium]|nr:thioredoxin family protein [Chloroflexota bacterium]
MAKPIVDGLERELEGQAQVVRLSVLSEMGRTVAQRHDIRAVPTFLIFDDQGRLIERQVGLPDRSKIKALVMGN